MKEPEKKTPEEGRGENGAYSAGAGYVLHRVHTWCGLTVQATWILDTHPPRRHYREAERTASTWDIGRKGPAVARNTPSPPPALQRPQRPARPCTCVYGACRLEQHDVWRVVGLTLAAAALAEPLNFFCANILNIEENGNGDVDTAAKFANAPRSRCSPSQLACQMRCTHEVQAAVRPRALPLSFVPPYDDNTGLV
jgi:hypothetical protein